MNIRVTINFRDLPKEIQDEMLSNKLEEHCIGITFNDTDLIIDNPSMNNDKFEIKENTIFALHFSDIFAEIPKWLHTVKCSIAAKDTFKGELPNGIFRCGDAKATATSFIDSDIKIVVTKIVLYAHGPSNKSLKNLCKLYRDIRSQYISKKETIELW